MTGAKLKFDVVIAGGGFAGVYCAKALARELGGEAPARVALIADRNHMVFQPMLAEVVGSSVSPRHVVNPIRLLCKGVTVLRGGIAAIDLDARRLSLEAGAFTPNAEVEFQHLVLALGGIVDLSRVPGMAEHALLLKSVGDAMELRGVVIDRIEEANLQNDETARKRLLTFVVVGGGFSGVETAGQILDLLRAINRFYPRIAKPDFRVILVHSAAHLLPEISPELGDYAEKNLRARGLDIILNARVTAMTASKIQLADGRVIESHTVVTTVGNAPHPLIVGLCKKHNIESVKGRVVTEPTLRVRGHANLWAAGDCAAVPMEEKDEGGGMRDEGKSPVPGGQSEQQKYCPPTAQFAYRQGLLLGKNLAAILIPPHSSLIPFRFTGLGELAAIGHHAAVAQIFGFRFSGFLAWWMWRTIYLMKLPGIERKLRVMIDWTLDLFFPRDMTLIRSRPTEVIQEMHLEKGDTLFHAGEPAQSFYIVKKGRIELSDAGGVVKSIREGEFFGERALMSDRVWRFTAVATEPGTLAVLDARAFATIDSNPVFHRLFEHSASQYATRLQVESMFSAISPELKLRAVREVMSKSMATLRAGMSIREALTLIARHPFNSFPLLDEEGRCAGVIGQTQIYDALQSGTITVDQTVSSLTPIPLPTIGAGASVAEAVECFCRNGRHKILVVDDENRLQGILTPVDLLAGNRNGEASS